MWFFPDSGGVIIDSVFNLTEPCNEDLERKKRKTQVTSYSSNLNLPESIELQELNRLDVSIFDYFMFSKLVISLDRLNLGEDHSV